MSEQKDKEVPHFNNYALDHFKNNHIGKVEIYLFYGELQLNPGSDAMATEVSIKPNNELSINSQNILLAQ